MLFHHSYIKILEWTMDATNRDEWYILGKLQQSVTLCPPQWNYFCLVQLSNPATSRSFYGSLDRCARIHQSYWGVSGNYEDGQLYIMNPGRRGESFHGFGTCTIQRNMPRMDTNVMIRRYRLICIPILALPGSPHQCNLKPLTFYCRWVFP